jgi:hypothetical protein
MPQNSVCLEEPSESKHTFLDLGALAYFNEDLARFSELGR